MLKGLCTKIRHEAQHLVVSFYELPQLIDFLCKACSRPCPKSRLTIDRFFLSGLWKSGRRLFGQGPCSRTQQVSRHGASVARDGTTWTGQEVIRADATEPGGRGS